MNRAKKVIKMVESVPGADKTILSEFPIWKELSANIKKDVNALLTELTKWDFEDTLSEGLTFRASYKAINEDVDIRSGKCNFDKFTLPSGEKAIYTPFGTWEWNYDVSSISELDSLQVLLGKEIESGITSVFLIFNGDAISGTSTFTPSSTDIISIL